MNGRFMGRIFFILFLIAAVPYGARTWWRMRMARGPRERAFIGRASVGIAMLTMLAVAAFCMMAARGQLFALPLIGVAGMAVRSGYRRVHARIQEEEADPLSRAKRVN